MAPGQVELWQTQPIIRRSSRPRGRRSGLLIDTGALRRARKEAGLSLAQVGGSELTRQAVHLIETGKVRPSWRSLELICRRLDRPIESLLLHREHVESARVADEARELEQLTQVHQYERIVELARDMLESANTPSLRAFVHFYAGQARLNLSEPAVALRHLRSARRTFEAIADPWKVAEAKDWEAVALDRKDDTRALGVGQDALRRYRALEPRRPAIEARMLEHIGTFLARRAEFESARTHYQEALRIVGTVRDLEAMARVYHGLAGCHRAAGDLRQAADLMHRAVALYAVEHELRPRAARVPLYRAMNDLGLLSMQLGQLDRAEELLGSALAGFAEPEMERFRSHVVLSLGELRRQQGRLGDAFDLVQQAIAQGTKLKQPVIVANGHRQLGELHEVRGEYERADVNFEKALDALAAASLVRRRVECEQAYQRLLEARQVGRTDHASCGSPGA